MRFDVVAGGEATGGRYAVLEVEAARGAGHPAHLHRHEDELLVLLDGALEVVVDGEPTTLAAGGAARMPRGVPHRFEVASDEARFLLLYLPAGLEEVTGAWSRDDDDLAALLAAGGVEWIPAGW